MEGCGACRKAAAMLCGPLTPAYSGTLTHTHIGPPQVHGEGTAELPLVPQLPQGELLQDFTVAPSAHSHNAGLLTPVDACKTGI